MIEIESWTLSGISKKEEKIITKNTLDMNIFIESLFLYSIKLYLFASEPFRSADILGFTCLKLDPYVYLP